MLYNDGSLKDLLISVDAKFPRENIRNYVLDEIKKNPCLVFSTSTCPYARKAILALKSSGAVFKNIELDMDMDTDRAMKIKDVLYALTGKKTVPLVFVGQTFVGGGDDVVSLQVRYDSFDETLTYSVIFELITLFSIRLCYILDFCISKM